MKLNINNIKYGIYLFKPYGEYFYKKKITAFVKSTNKPELLNEPIFVCSGKYIYGICKILEIKPISIEEFEKTFNEHKIYHIMRYIWWGNREPLYLYKFKILKLFDKPLEYNYKSGKSSFLYNIKIWR
ncbi:MAG: hypothetical protein ACTSVX_01530 [Promethearchaeota archaeon]